MNINDRTSDGPPRRSGLLLSARILPLFTVVAWALMIVVPVLDSGSSGSMGIRVTSLGDAPIDAEYLEFEFIVIWVAILTVAILAWLLSSLTWWSPLTMVLGLILLLVLLYFVLSPPLLMWDGQDEQGRPIGGMEVGRPAAGSLLWALGSAALIAAGACGLIGSRKRRRSA